MVGIFFQGCEWWQENSTVFDSCFIFSRFIYFTELWLSYIFAEATDIFSQCECNFVKGKVSVSKVTSVGDTAVCIGIVMNQVKYTRLASDTLSQSDGGDTIRPLVFPEIAQSMQCSMLITQIHYLLLIPYAYGPFLKYDPEIFNVRLARSSSGARTLEVLQWAYQQNSEWERLKQKFCAILGCTARMNQHYVCYEPRWWWLC